MYTLSEFNAMYNEVAELKAENKRLNKQLTMVAGFYSNFHKSKLKALTKYRDDLQNRHTKLKAAQKIKKIKPKNIIKAKAMLWFRVFGKSELTNKEIADQCFSTLGTINRLSTEVYNEKLQVNS